MEIPSGTVVEAVCRYAAFPLNEWKNMTGSIKVGEKVTVPAYPEWGCEIEYRGTVDGNFIVKCEHGEYAVVDSVTRVNNQIYKSKVDGLVIHDSLIEGGSIKILEVPLAVGQYRMANNFYIYKIMAMYDDKVVLRPFWNTSGQDFVEEHKYALKLALTIRP